MAERVDNQCWFQIVVYDFIFQFRFQKRGIHFIVRLDNSVGKGAISLHGFLFRFQYQKPWMRFIVH